MRFVGALDAILALAVAWKLLGHFETPSNPEKFVRWKPKKNSEENS